MSDRPSSSDAGAGALPIPVAFAPGDAAAPPVPAPSGTVVLLVAATPDRSWAAEAAIELSTAWARAGRRIVLADLQLESPTLHERLGSSNLEGMADVFLYGASIARSAHPVRGRGFHFISAGTYEPDARSIHRHARWPKLVAGFRDANASLVLFLPFEAAPIEALSRWADSAILLGVPGEGEARRLLRASPVRVDAVLHPPGEPAPPVTPPLEPEPSPVLEPAIVSPADAAESEPAPPATLPPPELPAPVPPEPALPGGGAVPAATEIRVEPRAAPPARDDEPDARELTIPPPPVRARRRQGTKLPLLLLAAVVLLFVGGFVLAQLRPELFARAGGARPAGDDTTAATTAAPAPTRAGQALPYSVRVSSFPSLPAAQQERASLQERMQGTALFLSPEDDGGVVYHHILAGLLPDTAAAGGLRETLIARGAVASENAADPWSLVQRTPFAFDLGEYGSAAQAAAASDSLERMRIPAYAVEVPYSDGSRRWQLYGGAYADSARAEALRQMLADAGLRPRLVLRVGLAPAGEEPAPQ